jgi:hypothetical protein
MPEFIIISTNILGILSYLFVELEEPIDITKDSSDNKLYKI